MGIFEKELNYFEFFLLETMSRKGKLGLLVLTVLILCNACSKPLEWPESPLYSFEEGESQTSQLNDLESAREAIVGH